MAALEPGREELEQIIKIRLLIARAGQNDSLRWWEDDSLTPAGAYLLERLFPFAPYVHGRKLALAAAAARHQAVFASFPTSRHLFRFGMNGEIEHAIGELRLNDFAPPEKPIDEIEELTSHLSDLIGEEPPKVKINAALPDGRLPVILISNASLIDQVHALARAYLQAEIGKPVFPFIEN